MRLCRVLFATMFGLLSASSASGVAGPIDYSYALIADTTGRFASFVQTPALNAGGTVTFAGTERGHFQGIYIASGGSIALIARGSYYEDRFVTIAVGVSSVPSINSTGNVAWVADTHSEHFGQSSANTIVQTSGNGSIADVQQGPFLSLGEVPSISDTGSVAFQGQLKTRISGIFLGTAFNTYTTIADTSQGFSSLDDAPSCNSRGVVAFHASLQAGGSGIFTDTGDGTTTTIADTTGPLAKLGVPSLNQGGTVAFRADLMAGGQGIFTGDGLTLARIADTSGPFSGFADGPSITNRGKVAFLADLKAGGKGLFAGTGLALQAVITTGDPLFDSTVSDIGFFRQGFNDASQAAFWAKLADGREVIALATPRFQPIPAVITYPASDGTQHENVFLLGPDGNLYLDTYDGAGWNWINLGQGGPPLASNPAVINYPGSDGVLHENVFVLASDGDLYIDVYDGGTWTWANLGHGGVPLSGTPAVINYPASDGTQHENVFLVGSDGNLYVDVYDGNRWTWANLGNAGVPLTGSPAVMNYASSDGVLYEHVFLQGSDGNLYLNAYSGSGWAWVNLGNGGVPLSGTPVVITYPGSDGVQHENVFLLGSDGNLYLDYYDGHGWTWVNLGNPGVPLSGSPTVMNYPGSNGALHEHVFLRGSDGQLYQDFYDGTGWTWVKLGNGGTPLSGGPAVMNYAAGDGLQHENVFLVGSDGNLYLDGYDGTSWTWVNLGGPGDG